MKETIDFEDFSKLDIRIGSILKAQKVEGSEKLILLSVDFGDEERQIISGIAKKYDPASLEGLQAVFLANLREKEIFGYKSQGMILAVGGEEGPVLVSPLEDVTPGSYLS